MRCKLCNKEVKTTNGLRKHMMGTKAYGGHELLEGQANSIISGTPVDVVLAGPPGTPQRPRWRLSSGNANQRSAVSRSSRTGDFLTDLFSEMALNKALPKYQFERRIDAILALFLPDLLALTKGWKVDVVAPEFPIKRPGNNQTTNADYVLYRHATSSAPAAWILLELKTDASSVRQTQLEAYEDARSRGMGNLRRDLDAVLAATKHKEKYRSLMLLVDAYPTDAPIEVLYFLPASALGSVRSTSVQILSFSELRDVELPNYSEAWAIFKKYLLPVLL